AGYGIAQGLGQFRFPRDAGQGPLPEREQLSDDRCGDSLARGGAGCSASTSMSVVTVNHRPSWLSLNSGPRDLCREPAPRVSKLSHPLDRGGGDLRGACSMEFIEPAPTVGPASRQPRAVIAPVLAHLLAVSGIAVHLQDAAIALEVTTHAIAR